MSVCRNLPVKGAALASVAVMLTACGAQDGGSDGAKDDGVVKIAANGWVGSAANAAVTGYLLEHELGHEVEVVEADEEESWHQLGTGEIDAILENWGHADMMELYGDPEAPRVVDGGLNGADGVIGWYVPAYLVEEYPDIATVEGIKKHMDLFREGGTGPGRFLSADPSFVTQDQGMINNFRLDMEIDYAGSEAEQIEEIRAAAETESPVVFYFYEPQWLIEEIDMVKVDFPDYVDLCEIDAEDIGCDYPDYELNKVFTKDFAESGGTAHEFLANWSWSNSDQNAVSRMIAVEGMEPEEAAKAWVEENPDAWQEWIPASQ